MRKIIFAVLIIIAFSSCSFITEDDIMLNVPSNIPLEEMTGEEIYYTLTYFDGEQVRSEYVAQNTKKLNVKVKKGSLSLFLLYPASTYTPLSAFYEPGKSTSVKFSYSDSSLIEFLINTAEYNPKLISRVSVSGLLARYEADEIDKIKFLDALEKGVINYSTDIKAEKKIVNLENLTYGRWFSDRDDIDDIIVKDTAISIELNLYEGVYFYVHEDLKNMLTIVISENGESVSKVDEFEIWY